MYESLRSSAQKPLDPAGISENWRSDSGTAGYHDDRTRFATFAEIESVVGTFTIRRPAPGQQGCNGGRSGGSEVQLKGITRSRTTIAREPRTHYSSIIQGFQPPQPKSDGLLQKIHSCRQRNAVPSAGADQYTSTPGIGSILFTR